MYRNNVMKENNRKRVILRTKNISEMMFSQWAW